MKALHTVALFLTAVSLNARQPRPAPEHSQSNVQWVRRLAQDVRRSSFPRLSGADIRIRSFRSDSDYFQARFSLFRFFVPGKMQYVLRVNDDERLQAVPQEAIRAVIAHELAHVRYYASGNRLRLLRLMRLTDSDYRRDFERGADLEAVRLGYAPGLQQYRLWLYQNVPAKALPEKKRDYLSPAEIEAAASCP